MSIDPLFAEEELYDPRARYADDDDTDRIGRPERTEDRVPRDKKDRPRILPLGEAMPQDPNRRDKVLRSYMRPSSAGKMLENTHLLELWKQRKAAEGTAMSKTLQLEWASIDPEDKRKGNHLAEQARKLAGAEEAARRGTATHAITERHDRGLPIRFIPEGFENDLPAWLDVMKDFDILDVECFVVEDIWKGAGTFDRLIHYWEPCVLCGKYNRILDLKTGGESDFGHATEAMQLAIYAHGSYYDPATGVRTPLPDVCTCRGIIVRLPQSSGQARLEWVNIAQAWEEGMELRAKLKAYQAKSNWVAPFVTREDFTQRIKAASTRDEMNAIWARFKDQWLPQHTRAVEDRLAEVKYLQEGIQ